MLRKNVLYNNKKNKCINYLNGVYKVGNDKLSPNLKSSQVLNYSIKTINLL